MALQARGERGRFLCAVCVCLSGSLGHPPSRALPLPGAATPPRARGGAASLRRSHRAPKREAGVGAGEASRSQRRNLHGRDL